MGYVVTLVEPDATAQRAGVLARACATRGWTRAEWLEVMREAPFRNHYGKSVALNVLEEVVKESRRWRHQLLNPRLTAAEVVDLCERSPDLDAEDFGIATFAGRDGGEARYRYAPWARHVARPAPELLEPAGRNDEEPAFWVYSERKLTDPPKWMEGRLRGISEGSGVGVMDMPPGLPERVFPLQDGDLLRPSPLDGGILVQRADDTLKSQETE